MGIPDIPGITGLIGSAITWALVAVYTLGYVFSFRRIAGQWAWHYAENGIETNAERTPTGEHWFGAIIAGLVLSSIWPLSLPIAYAIASSRNPDSLLYMPPKVRERINRERIMQLEREAGIRPDGTRE